MVLGSLIDVWDHVNPFPPKIKAKLMPIEMLKSFSIVKNGNIILSTATGKGHLNCLTGMRSISMCWIIYGHLYLLGQYLGFSKSLENRKLVEEVRNYFDSHYIILYHLIPISDCFRKSRHRISHPSECLSSSGYFLLYEWNPCGLLNFPCF